MKTLLPPGAQAIGYKALVDKYDLKVVPHHRWSYIVPKGARKVLDDQVPALYLYDIGYALENSHDFEHLAFALKHEGLNLDIINCFFKLVSQDDVANYIRQQPSGKYHRMMWYLYESLTNQILDIPGLVNGSYVNLLDSGDYYTCEPVAKKRQRINDNLLGNITGLCPFVRKTECLQKAEATQLDRVAREIVESYDPRILERASTFLYTHETMSSYEIERERPDKKRLTRFIDLVKKAETTAQLTHETLFQLQGSVVEERFAQYAYRTTQNFVGHVTDWRRQNVDYISPCPEAVIPMMNDLLDSLQRMLESNVHPIVMAAAISFAFVYIHPFDDGNGRLHRFLIHYILHTTRFSPKGMIFPISAVILADMQRYYKVLETFSQPLMECITGYEISDDGILTVEQETTYLYRFVDYTAHAEFLANCIEQTIATDFKKELEYLTRYDAAKQAISQIVDMPDHLLDLFIVLVTQNNGALSSKKRQQHFAMLTDDEVEKMEAVVRDMM